MDNKKIENYLRKKRKRILSSDIVIDFLDIRDLKTFADIQEFFDRNPKKLPDFFKTKDEEGREVLDIDCIASFLSEYGVFFTKLSNKILADAISIEPVFHRQDDEDEDEEKVLSHHNIYMQKHPDIWIDTSKKTLNTLLKGKKYWVSFPEDIIESINMKFAIDQMVVDIESVDIYKILM